jgi:predicted ester cyclase
MHSFPDRRSTIEDLVGEGDRVVARIRMTGRNTGGLPQFGIPANDKPVDIQWIQISRHAQDGRIAETWAQLEAPQLMQQLGAMPMPEM